MKYDDASWHSGGDFPADVPPANGGNHIGYFLTWCLLHDLGGELHFDDFATEFAALQRREITPGRYLMTTCDGKLTEDELNEEGNAFALRYYADEDGMKAYINDYEVVFANEATQSLYHVVDSWANYDRIAVAIAAAYRRHDA